MLAPADAAKRFSDRKHPDNNIILTRHVGLAVDQSCLKRAYRRAKNILVVGGTGSGKTHMYVMPNALQANQDFFFTDTKGTLSKNLGQMFADRGYDVLVFSTKDPAASARYNTLAYLESPIDIIEWVRAFISITNGEEAKSEEAFWTNTTVLLLLTQVSYLVSYCPDEDRNLNGLITLLSLAQASEGGRVVRQPPTSCSCARSRKAPCLSRSAPNRPSRGRAAAISSGRPRARSNGGG